MSALNVLTIDSAKDFLKVDFSDENDIIEDIIKEAVSLVEQFTCYRLYKREETIKTSLGSLDLFQYPLNEVVSVMDKDGEAVSYNETFQPLRTELCFSCCNSVKTITIDTGYEDPDDIEPALRGCVKKIVAYLYENRSINKSELPQDLQMMLAPYKRFTLF